MARKHVFPVCRPSFNKLDVETIDESRTLPLGANNNLYQTTGSDGTKGVANFSTVIEEIAALYFVVDGGGGEYLLSDISNPSETTLTFEEGVLVNLYSAHAIKQSAYPIFSKTFSLSEVNPSPIAEGSIFCVGSKPSTDITISHGIPSVSVIIGTDIINPFDTIGFGLSSTTTYSSGGNIWVTVMFTGTRFVILGSNSWIS